MILAAGEGRRMQPLTLSTPKPLLQAGKKTLIEHQLDKLIAAGIESVIINVAYLGQQIMDFLGDGERYGVAIQYSLEPEPLETAGAINHALTALDNQPFLLVNSDVWCDYPLEQLTQMDVGDAHLVMIPNPAHNSSGDFGLNNGLVVKAGSNQTSCTFSGLSVFHPSVIESYPRRRPIFPLREVFHWLAPQKRLTGELYRGAWMDIGTPERLAVLREVLS